jgi:phosphoglycerate dehydrogenase-like enzyme
MKLLIYPEIDDLRLNKLTDRFPGLTLVPARTLEQALAAITDADAFFGKLTPELLSVARGLRWVQSPTASLEHYVFPELIAHPCTLTNMRGLFSDVIADHVLGYILCFARNLHLYVRQQQRSLWAPIGGETARSTFATGPGQVTAMDRAHLHLSDCTAGIVGLGAIGAEVARRAAAFGMRVVAVDPRVGETPPEVSDLWAPDRLHDLLAQSDFVIIAAPHTPQTAGLFGREQFVAMRRTAYLINIGRGAIVKLDALVDALDAGEIAGAALDVFEIEPLPPTHPLWQRENVLITPHVAACSVRIAERHFELLVDNIGRFLRGDPLRNVVSKADWF